MDEPQQDGYWITPEEHKRLHRRDSYYADLTRSLVARAALLSFVIGFLSAIIFTAT